MSLLLKQSPLSGPRLDGVGVMSTGVAVGVAQAFAKMYP
jgi:hypothetical protein